MAFEMLSDKLQGLFKKIRGQSKLTEANMEEMLREIRFALIDADVNNEVVKAFLTDVKEKMIGQEVLKKVSPGQMVVKIINDEIVKLLGGSNEGIKFAPQGRPTIIMMVGLQGGGKTTAVSKIAYMLKNKQAKKPLLVACDTFNNFITVSRCVSLGNFQYRLIICKDSFLDNGSVSFLSLTCALEMWPLRGSRSIKPGKPAKKNDTGVSSAALSSNRREAEILLPALSYF